MPCRITAGRVLGSAYPPRMRHGIVPPYLLSRIAALDPERYPAAAPAAQRALTVDGLRRAARLEFSLSADAGLEA